MFHPNRYLANASLLALLIMLLSLLLLTGCAASVETPVALQPPMLLCDDDPPLPDDAAPASLAPYVLRLWSAGQSCREAVGGYRSWAAGLAGSE